MDLTGYKNDCNRFLDDAVSKLDGVPPAKMEAFLTWVNRGIEDIYQKHVPNSMSMHDYMTLLYQIASVVGAPRDSHELTRDALLNILYTAMTGIRGLPDDTEKLRGTYARAHGNA